jgi:uncharacterized protein YceK
MLETIMRTLLVVLIVFTLTGCATMRVVDTQAPSPYAEVNKATQGRVVQVQLADGRTLEATDLDVAPDVASYVDADGQMHTVATDTIEQIRLVRHGRGALEGLGIGLMMGAASGAMVGLASGSTCDEGDLFCDPGFFALAFGALGGAAGSLVGLAAGSVRGHHTVYHLRVDEQALAERDVGAAKQVP